MSLLIMKIRIYKTSIYRSFIDFLFINNNRGIVYIIFINEILLDTKLY